MISIYLTSSLFSFTYDNTILLLYAGSDLRKLSNFVPKCSSDFSLFLDNILNVFYHSPNFFIMYTFYLACAVNPGYINFFCNSTYRSSKNALCILSIFKNEPYVLVSPLLKMSVYILHYLDPEFSVLPPHKVCMFLFYWAINFLRLKL